MTIQGVPACFDNPVDVAEFQRIPNRPGIELYRAHIVHHSFEPHTHEAFGFGAIESGVERCRYAGSEHLAPADSIVLMNPDELHTGCAESAGGWRYRMIYINSDMLSEITGEPKWWFDRPVVDNDRDRARRLSALLAALWRAKEPLAFDSLLLQLVTELRPHARVACGARDGKPQRFAHVLDYMRTHLERRLSLDELAEEANLSPFHFLRTFQAQYHVTPQQMLMALRLFEAKRLLAYGEKAAQVAVATGLTDQAHLTRAFVRRYGVTPARYQRQLQR